MEDHVDLEAKNKLDLTENIDIVNPEAENNLSLYKAIKEQSKKIESQLEEFKDWFLEFVKKNGDYNGEAGKVSLVPEKLDGFNYDNDGVESMMLAWTQSTDPIMNSCGMILKSHRKKSTRKSYVKIT